MSLEFYNKMVIKPVLKPYLEGKSLEAANNATLEVLGCVDVDVCVEGLTIPVDFAVIRNLNHNCILGTPFLNETQAVLNFKHKTLTLYDNVLVVPLVTKIENDNTLRTVSKVRIPPFSEAVLPASLRYSKNCNNSDELVGITEPLPATVNKSVRVASVLQSNKNADGTCKPIIMCRVLNPTRKWVYLPKNFPFAYLSPLDCDRDIVGVSSIDVCNISQQSDVSVGVDDVSNNVPSHAERLKYLTDLGIKIGTDICTAQELEQLTALLYNFRDIFAVDYKDVPLSNITPHTIPLLNDKPVTQRRFRYSPAQERELERQCDVLHDAGIIKESTSVWNSPVFLIKKPDNTSRFLVDFRAVNAQVEPLYCGLPALEDVFDDIGDEKPIVYSVMDLKAGFYSIPLDAKSQEYTAFSTKSRHFQWTRLPMGYKNSPTAFTQALTKIFAKELRSTLLIYVDDIIGYSRSVANHLQLLTDVFTKFRKHKLRLHPAKLRFAMSSVNFLGYTITQNGYTVDSSRTSIVQNYPRPKNQRDIRKFVGLTNFYRRLIRDYSKRAAPLRDLLCKNTEFIWTDRQEKAFCDLRDALCSPPVLGFADRNKPFRLTLDACASGLSYILSNVNECGSETVIHYGARATTKAEKHYCATDLELAALLTGVKTYHSYLANAKFEIISDHISLTYLKNLKFGPSRLVRASMALSQYDYTIKFLAGRCNGAADSLSRLDNIKADDLTLYQQQRFDDNDDDFVCVVNDKTDTKPNNSETDGQTSVRDDNAGPNEASQLNEPVACAVNNALLYRPSYNFESMSNDVCLTNVDFRMTKDACCGTSDDDDNGEAKPAATATNDVVIQQLEASFVNNDAVIIDQSPRLQVEKAKNDTKTADADEAQTDLIHEKPNLLKAIDRTRDDDDGRPVVSTTAENFVDEIRRTQTQYQPILIAGIHKSTKRPTRKKSQNFGDSATNTQTDSQTNAVTRADNSDEITLTARSADCSGGAACSANSSSATGGSTERNADDASDTDDVVITLATQRQDSDFEHIINYLLCGSLPSDDKVAKRTAILADYYTILDEKLFHLTVPRRKNNTSQQTLMRQLCIPSKMRNEVMRKYHSQLMHVGAEKMYLSLRCKVYWPGMYGDIRHFVGSCQTCVCVKPNTHAKKAKIQNREIPTTLFHTIHIDHLKISAPNATHRYQYVLLITDALSLQLELVPTKGTSAKETANALFDVWFCRYGVPAEIISDRHQSFCGDLIQCLLRLCGAKHILISPRRPQSNGLSEQNNARIITAIKIHCGDYSDWHKLLPAIAGAYRASVTPTRQHSPFAVMYGCEMRLPVDQELAENLPGHARDDMHADQFRDRMKILRSNAKDLAQFNREKTTAAVNKTKTSHEFRVGDRVYIANEVIKPGQNKKFEPMFRGPYLVVAKSDHNTYKLSHLYTGKILKSFIHYDKLRPSNSARQMRREKQANSIQLIKEKDCTNLQTGDVGLHDRQEIKETDNVQPNKFKDAIFDTGILANAEVKESHFDTVPADRPLIGRAESTDLKETPAKVKVNITQPSADVCLIDKNYDGSGTHESTRAVIGQYKRKDLKEVPGESKPVSLQNAYDDVTSVFSVFPFDNSILTVDDSTGDDYVDYESVDEGDEGLHSYDDVCAKDMRKILSIKRNKRCLRCCVLMKNGERVLCSLLRVPTKLLSAFRLRRYHRKRLAK